MRRRRGVTESDLIENKQKMSPIHQWPGKLERWWWPSENDPFFFFLDALAPKETSDTSDIRDISGTSVTSDTSGTSNTRITHNKRSKSNTSKTSNEFNASDASKSSAALSRLSSSFLKTYLSEMTSCKLRNTEIDSRQKQLRLRTLIADNWFCTMKFGLKQYEIRNREIQRRQKQWGPGWLLPDDCRSGPSSE